MSKKRGYEHRRGHSTPKFIMVRFDMFDGEAFRDLDPVARALYLELKRRYNGSNNGRIGLGCREAASALKVGTNTAALAFKKLRQHDLIEAMSPATVTGTGRKATEWLLTEHTDDTSGAPASNRFRHWKNAEPVADIGQGVLPERRKRAKSAQKAVLRPTSATQAPVLAPSASYDNDTYTSSHRQGVAQGAAAAPVHTGRGGEGDQAGGFVPVGATLASSALLARARGGRNG